MELESEVDEMTITDLENIARDIVSKIDIVEHYSERKGKYLATIQSGKWFKWKHIDGGYHDEPGVSVANLQEKLVKAIACHLQYLGDPTYDKVHGMIKSRLTGHYEVRELLRRNGYKNV